MFQHHQSYVFPGGYQITYTARDGRDLCPTCAMIEQRETSWFIHWEGPPLRCDRCDKEILSEYGKPEPKKPEHLFTILNTL